MAADAGSNTEIKASLILLAATAAALVCANSALAGLYKAVLSAPLQIPLGFDTLDDTVKGWIKNALMAIFFVFVGLEIKYEFARGALSDRQRAILPFAAAVGGMAIPAVVFLSVASAPAFRGGWAIPSATDIAFAVGVVGLLGTRYVSPALKAFLLAVAVIDDLGAILIIAVAYTAGLSSFWLSVAVAVTVGLFAMSRLGVTNTWAYLGVGAILWYVVLKSGINPTLAGVVTALFVPIDARGGPSPLKALLEKLKYPVLFGIMPVFAFANAGVPLTGLGLGDLTHPLTLGIALGLFVGKPIGITGAAWLCVRTGVAKLPQGTDWPRMLGIAWIAGIGFTMSLFIGTLAFGDGPVMDQVRLGVLLGSTLSALAGIAVLTSVAKRAAARA
jgi:NhaA family Na+:H+ antiporter